MNNKRFLFIIVAIAGAIAIGLVLWYILRPVLPSLPGSRQPPALPTRVETQFDPSKSVPTPPVTPTVKVDPTSPEEKERQAQEALKRQALDFAARQGTYSNADDFDGLREIFPSVTAELKAKLETRREQLRRDHPAFGQGWSQTIRALSAELDVKSIPVLSKSAATVYVQAQQVTEEPRSGKTTNLVRLTVSFTKQGDVWIPSDITLEPLAP